MKSGEDKVKLSCCKVGCDSYGGQAIWVEDTYFVWLCYEHYDEYKKNHPDYLKEKKK